MFKLQITFVALALVATVLSSPLPTPSQQLASSANDKALSLPGLDIVSGLLGGGGDDSSDDDDDGSSGGGLLGSLLKRQDDGDATSDINQDLTGTLGRGIGKIPSFGTHLDSDTNDSDENARRDEALSLPLLGGTGGASTGLGGLTDTLGGILGSLGKGLGQLL